MMVWRTLGRDLQALSNTIPDDDKRKLQPFVGWSFQRNGWRRM